MATTKKGETFTAEERAAMRAKIKEEKAANTRAESERMLQAAIAEMPKADREIAERIHALVKDVAPDLAGRTWYGMPAYAKDGNVLCFFQPASKFKARYGTFGFNDRAKLDSGGMWPVAFALNELTPDVEKKLRTLVKKAARD